MVDTKTEEAAAISAQYQLFFTTHDTHGEGQTCTRHEPFLTNKNPDLEKISLNSMWDNPL